MYRRRSRLQSRSRSAATTKLERVAAARQGSSRCACAGARRPCGRSTWRRTRGSSSRRTWTRSSSPPSCEPTSAPPSRCRHCSPSAGSSRARPVSPPTPSLSPSPSRLTPPPPHLRFPHVLQPRRSAPRSTRADLFVRTALVEMYAKAGRAELARAAFDEAPRRDVFLCNVMLAAYVSRGEVAEARKVFDGMRERDLVSWNTMIHGYAVSGDVSMAREIFDGTADRDAFSWSSMISAYTKGRRSKEALELWREMRLARVAPDCITMVSVLSACSDMGALAIGAEVHQFVESNRVEVDVKLGTALVDMYAKCGDIENSLIVFRAMPAKDVLTWSSMIIGLANHGLGHDALGLFSEMISEGLQPNEITFIGVLIACTHVGLVSDGKKYFSSMSDVHGVVPRIEHYGCMVDLLGRAGHVEEAMELIRSIPFEPDAVIWRALLGACRIHKNVDIAEEAMTRLRVLDPLADGHYVLLSNIYAQANSWEGVAEMRKTIRRENIQRVPGRSSIEWENTVHEFVSGDRSHPRFGEIYKMLEEMMDRLRQAGYRPMTSLVLQDIDEQSKTQALAEHSEKLAIAFGLLTTPARSTLRITKNLRACEDCHSAFKLISLVYDRKLVVRDRNRFHHFSEGQCSCKDYW